MQKLVTFLQAYKFYLMGQFNIYDLQKAAEYDFENYTIVSDNLFDFAYVLVRDRHDVYEFEDCLDNIIEEFNLPREISIVRNDVLEYVDYLMKEDRSYASLSIESRLANILDWLFHYRYLFADKTRKVDESEEFKAILDELYKKPDVSEALLSDYYNLDTDSAPEEYYSNLRSNLRRHFNDLINEK